MTEVQRLTAFLQVEPSVIETQQWTALLPSLLKRAAEYEILRSRIVELEVEAEQTTIESEKRVAEVSEELKQVRSESTQLKGSGARADGVLSSLEKQKADILAENEKLQSTISTLTSQNSQLLEEKRQALALVDRQSQAIARHEEEYRSLSDRHQTLRKDTARLESQVNEAQSAISSAHFKNASSEQSLALMQKNVDYLNGELDIKSKQFSTYRQESSALLATMQQEIDDAKAQATTAEHSLDLTRQRNQDLSISVDKHLIRVSELQEQLNGKEELFRAEMATQVKLIELHERSAKDAKARILQLESSIQSRTNNNSKERSVLQQNVEVLEAKCVELENQVGNLSNDVSRLEAELSVANDQLQNGSGTLMNGVAILSPSAQTMQSSSQSAVTLTELYSEFSKTKQDLEHERRKNDKIQTSFDALIKELESRAPQLQQQREEYSSLQYELASMSESMQSMTAQNEHLDKELRAAHTRSQDQVTEIRSLELQVLDLSRQVQRLLFEIEEQGFRAEPLSEAEITGLNLLLDSKNTSNSAVDQLISDRLVLFKSIQELQQLNMQQLKVTRQLGAKMERDEETSRQKLSESSNTALLEARETIVKMADEVASMQIKMDSYIRERDMFRGMLNNSGDRSISAVQVPAIDSMATTASDEALRTVENDFEVFKRESTADQKALAEQLSAVTQERGNISLQAARLEAQLELAEERNKMLRDSLEMSKKEMEESRKRSLQIQENHAKQEYRSQQQIEDLVQIKAMLDGARNENANLKAEKQLWKSIEKRMTEDLASIREERDRLNSLFAKLQAMQSERERTETESLQRYNTQISSLEADLEITKARLSSEREEVRRLTISKDQTSRESQEKLENILRQAAEAREAHAIAVTQKDGAQSRVVELETQIQALQEKSARSSAPLQYNSQSLPNGDDEQLQVEVTELRMILQQSKADLERARQDATQMQEVAKNAEHALADMNKSYDEYKLAMEEQSKHSNRDRAIAEQRLEDMSSQLQAINQELTSINRVEDEKRQLLVAEIESLKSRVESLLEVQEKYTIANSFYQEDLRSQAEIAQEAQQNYETELVRHAEAAQALRTLRQDYNELRSELLTLRQQSNGSEKRLLDESTSWQNQKDLYERELSEVRTRLTDLRHQNELLHAQFESLTANRSSNLAEQNEPSSSTDDNVDGLQSVIKYLRRENEIAEVSLEAMQQENKRLRQELAHLSKSFDDAQTTLAVERQKTAQMSANSEAKDETRTMSNELSMVRESNSTLRAEHESNLRKMRSLETQLEAITKQLEPLELQIKTSQAETEAKDAEIQLLSQDNERWRQRNQAILQKYERIDPTELQQLRDQAAGAGHELNELRISNESLQRQLQERETSSVTLQEQLSAQVSRFDTLMQQSKDRIKKERTEAKTALATAQAMTEQLEAKTVEIEALRAQIEERQNTVASESEKASVLRSQINALEAQISQQDIAAKTQSASIEAEMNDLKASNASLTKERDEARASKQDSTFTADTTDLETELAQLKTELEKQKTQYRELRLVARKNREELTAKVSELSLELEQSNSQTKETSNSSEPISESKIQERIDEAVSRALQTHAEDKPSTPNNDSQDSKIQERIQKALAKQEAANQVETQRLIAEALENEAKSRPPATDETSQSHDTLATLLQAKEEEYKAKLKTITKEKVDAVVEIRLPKKVEAEKQKWQQSADAEKSKLLEEKEAEHKQAMLEVESRNREALEARAASVRRESDMRVQLKLGMKDKRIAQLEKDIELLKAGKADTPPETTAQPVVRPADETENSNGKSLDLLDGLSEQSEGDHDGNSAAATESGETTSTPNVSSDQVKTDAPAQRSRIARGGKQLRGGRRGGHQGTKRAREDGGNGEGEQPAKKAA